MKVLSEDDVAHESFASGGKSLTDPKSNGPYRASHVQDLTIFRYAHSFKVESALVKFHELNLPIQTNR